MVFDLRIEKMVQGGEGLARLPDGRVCFVAGALPGEVCQVELTQNRKDFTRGRVTKILEASPDRVAPKCPLFGRCGGCSLQHLKSERQGELLAQVERDNFKRIAKCELPENFVVHTGNPWGYRNRARVVNCGKSGFGFREQESNKLIPFKDCPVLTPDLNNFLKTMAPALCAKNPKIKDLNVFDNGEGEISYFYRGMPSKDLEKVGTSVVRIDGREIESDASVFFQSNLGLLPELVAEVKKAALAEDGKKSPWLIDLFSGVGFFAALLQDGFERITTVEREPGCLKHAKKNLAGVKGENVAEPAEDWLQKHVVDVPATLIVDPPRTGLPRTALDAIVKSSVKKMIYVSCDPVTLARDFALLRQAGFQMESAQAFAFYPQTPHMEMMAVLTR